MSDKILGLSVTLMLILSSTSSIARPPSETKDDAKPSSSWELPVLSPEEAKKKYENNPAPVARELIGEWEIQSATSKFPRTLQIEYDPKTKWVLAYMKKGWGRRVRIEIADEAEALNCNSDGVNLLTCAAWFDNKINFAAYNRKIPNPKTETTTNTASMFQMWPKGGLK